MSDVPTGTYRLQLTPDFGFAEAAGVVGYLASLGVSHVYLSPILEAAPGSTHGYDVAEHDRISSVLGGEEGYRALVGELRKHGMGVVVDIVPNHMAFESPAVKSVVEQGKQSPFAHWFDIDWEAADHLVVPGQGEPNYRRFFDISGLICLRQEDPDVFEATHALLFRLRDEGLLDGLRVDHVDGLSDPGGYLAQLKARAGCWIVIEKILSDKERTPEDWAVRGTTGYEAAGAVDGLLIDQAAEDTFTELYTRLTGGPAAFPPVVRDGKQFVIDHGLAPEVRRLHRELVPLMPDLTPDAVYQHLVHLLLELDVYRTYEKAEEPGWREFTVRFHQTTTALAARGVEDTAFYRWSRLTSRNEVGGEPARFSVGPTAFHRFCADALDQGMTTLSTHDTKRQEDVRARLAVLTELPDEWTEFVSGRTDGSDLDYLLWQTLIGAWPLDAERLTGYLTKAMREAKTHTTWTEQNPDYETATLDRARKALDDPGVADFAASLAPYERSNILAQKLIQLTMPGVPDVYQGCELTGYALVDPDNRRPVDYETRRTLLAALDEGQTPGSPDEEKLLLASRVLRLRREHPDWFTAPYEPVSATGPAADHVVAFRRGQAVTIATRLPRGLERAGGWRDTELPLGEGAWRDVLTGRPYGPMSELLSAFPVALLVPEETG